MDAVITREKYLQKVKPYIGKQMIKVLTGQRRVGKTTILKQIMNLVRQEDKEANTIYINKEQNEFKDIIDADDLYQFIKSKISGNKRNYAFIDEIQEINEFETALRELFAEGIDLYCTGGNASMLSGDLATHLSGRYIEFHINSLSYNEFLQFHSLQNNKDSLTKYIRFGGLPYLIHLPLEEEIVYGYLKSIYNTIILKDVVAR